MFLLIFWNIPACMVLLHPARLSILGNFPVKMIFIVVNFGKFQPARPYSILHVYQFWDFFHPTRLFHPALLLYRIE